MSSVRMCDRCGNVFSENSEGWSTDSRTVNRIRDDGKRYTVTMQVDQCADCVGSPAPVVPRVPAAPSAITAAVGSAAHAATIADEIKAAEDADKDATIALLQLQLEDARDRARAMGVKPEVVIPTRLDPAPGTATRMPNPVREWESAT